MLHAILHGKIRGLFDGIEEGISWRSAYKKYEDFLTASVLGRMAYLPDDSFWKIIKNSSVTSGLPREVGFLDEIEFWPKWTVPSWLSKKFIEPDAYISFDKVDMLVEAKRDDSKSQYLTQWIKQILSLLYKRDLEGGERKPIIYWAIGGLGDTITQQEINRTAEKLQKEVTKKYPNEHIQIAITPWTNLLKTFLELKYFLLEKVSRTSRLINIDNKRNLLRLVNDIIEALRLHNIKEWHFLRELNKYWSDSQIETEAIEYYKRKLSMPTSSSYKLQIFWSVLNKQENNFDYALSYKWIRRS